MTADTLIVGGLVLVAALAATALIFVVKKLGERGIDAIDRRRSHRAQLRLHRTGAATVIPIDRARRLRAARLQLNRSLLNRRPAAEDSDHGTSLPAPLLRAPQGARVGVRDLDVEVPGVRRAGGRAASGLVVRVRPTSPEPQLVALPAVRGDARDRAEPAEVPAAGVTSGAAT